MRYNWICPYCKHDNSSGFLTLPSLTRTAAHHTSTIEHCNIEDGGCDRRVVVDVLVTTKATAHKIEES